LCFKCYKSCLIDFQLFRTSSSKVVFHGGRLPNNQNFGWVGEIKNTNNSAQLDLGLSLAKITLLIVATMFATQHVCNAARAAHALRSDQHKVRKGLRDLQHKKLLILAHAKRVLAPMSAQARTLNPPSLSTPNKC
jgi:hypothetical protein